MVEISKSQKIFSFIIMMIDKPTAEEVTEQIVNKPTEEEGINQIVNKPE